MSRLKETVKSLILALLICSSVILTSKIWFSEELWSQSGFNSFDYVMKTTFSKITSFFFQDNSYNSLEFEQIFYPKQIIVSSGSVTELVAPSSESYVYFNSSAKDLLAQFFKEQEFEEITEEELLRAYKAPSVYYDFSSSVSFNMLGDYFGEKISENLNLTNTKHLLISLKKNSSGKIDIYAKNNKTKKVYRLSVLSSIDELTAAADGIIDKSSPEEKFYSYAFENSFDKPSESVDTKLLLDSYMVININNGYISSISPYIPYEADDSGLMSEILNCFSMKISSARHYTDKQQTENFVENFATLKINKNGILQYDSVDDSKGIPLNGTMGGDYGFVKSAGDLAAEIYEILEIDSKNIVFDSINYNSEKDEYKITFDYLVGGIKATADYVDNPITVIIRKGRIVSLTQLLMGYQTEKAEIEVPSMINALDNFYSKYDVQKNKDVIIEDMYVVYNVDEYKRTTVKWNVVLSDGTVVLI